MATILYRIYDPRFPIETRYYGITDYTVERRLSDHLLLARLGRKKLPILDWIRKLTKENIIPQIEAISVFETRAQGSAAEIEYIAKGRSLGLRLLNLADGGDGGRQPDSVLARVSATKKLHVKSNPEYYNNLAKTGSDALQNLRDNNPDWEKARVEAIKLGIKPGQRANSQRKRMLEKPELRKELSTRYKGKPRIGIGRRKPVKCSLGREFDTGKAAAEYYQISPSEVSWSICNADYVLAQEQKIQFSYVNAEDEKERNKRRKVVSSDGLEFSSITAAAKHYNADWVTIQRAIKDKRKYKNVTFSLELIPA